jgi:DNA-binding response OmpR family regulator
MRGQPAGPRIVWIAPQAPPRPLRDAFVDHGYTLLHVEPGARAERACGGLRPDALLLALDETDVAHVQAVVGALRRAHDAALLVLVPATALAAVHEVLLLEAGADVVAPRAGASIVLLARLRRLLKRPRALRSPPPGAVEVDLPHCSVRIGGRALELGRSAVALLHELAQVDGACAPRAQLARHLGPAAGGASRTLDMAICRLRRALRVQGVHEVGIEAVHGHGYRLVTHSVPCRVA